MDDFFYKTKTIKHLMTMEINERNFGESPGKENRLKMLDSWISQIRNENIKDKQLKKFILDKIKYQENFEKDQEYANYLKGLSNK